MRLHLVIVCRGDWLLKAVNMKDDNNGDAVYVGIFLTLHNPVLVVDKL